MSYWGGFQFLSMSTPLSRLRLLAYALIVKLPWSFLFVHLSSLQTTFSSYQLMICPLSAAYTARLLLLSLLLTAYLCSLPFSLCSLDSHFPNFVSFLSSSLTLTQHLINSLFLIPHTSVSCPVKGLLWDHFVQYISVPEKGLQSKCSTLFCVYYIKMCSWANDYTKYEIIDNFAHYWVSSEANSGIYFKMLV